MSTHSFQLQPFPGSAAPDISITGVVTRDRQQLNLVYMISGALDRIQLPALNPNPTRAWELWETTCFEAFFGVSDASNYWELNLAPNGNWNAFALTNYREGIANETGITAVEITTNRQPNGLRPTAGQRFTLSATIPLSAIMPARKPLELSVTTVIQTQDQAMSYWAIAHCGDEADFHRRDSFVLNLVG
jgi:hypothetical protein